MTALRFGLTLANRDVVTGGQTAQQLIELAVRAEHSGRLDSVWVGDSLFVNRRLDSLTLLAAIAARTERVLLGPACMGSFALRNPLTFAYEWASLDQIARGRTRLIACAGGGAGPLWAAEAEALGVPPEQRRKRVVEHIELLRRLWSEDEVSYQSAAYGFRELTLEPKPLQDPCPIWLASNAQRLASGATTGSDAALRRVGRIADGWMTHTTTPEAFAHSWQTILATAGEHGRDSAHFGNCLYHNIHISDDAERSLHAAKAFLDGYYETDFSLQRTRAWCTVGTPEECVADLRRWTGTGLQRITLRLCAVDQEEQLERLVTEVVPYVNSQVPA